MTDETPKTQTEKTKHAILQKKPYERPSWEVEQVFEKAALACTKGDPRSCPTGTIS